jgi:hypothetical protein
MRDSSARHALSPAAMAADAPGTFVGVLSPAGVLLDGLPAPAATTEWLATDAVGTPLWEAPWWAWSPDVQDRLRAAVRRAVAGEVVSYGDTVRVRGNMLVTVGLTVAPMVSPDGVTGVRCSVLDPGGAGGSGPPRHLSAPTDRVPSDTVPSEPASRPDAG